MFLSFIYVTFIYVYINDVSPSPNFYTFCYLVFITFALGDWCLLNFPHVWRFPRFPHINLYLHTDVNVLAANEAMQPVHEHKQPQT